ncbi:methylenetetrahydrofolate reductase [Pseudomonas sp. MDT1-16]
MSSTSAEIISPADRSLLTGYSLEITAKDNDAVSKTQVKIPQGTPISITYLPGETPDARVRAATTIRRLGFVPVPHISARRIPSKDALQDFLLRISQEAQADRVFVIGGDLHQALGPYNDALALIQSGLFEDHGIKKIGIAGYPEGHPDISDETLWSALHSKAKHISQLGLPLEVATQFAFDASPILAWLERLRNEGIEARVRVGVPGPASVKTLLRFAARCGVGASTKVLSKYGLSITKLLSSAGPDSLLNELESRLNPKIHGDVKIHFYPFGGFEQTANWVNTFTKGR